MVNTKINPITLILILVFLYPLLKGFLFKFSSNNLKAGIDEINRNISFIIALVLGVYYGRKIFLQHEIGIYNQIYKAIPDTIIQYIENNNFIIYAVAIPLLVLIFYKVIKLICDLVSFATLHPILDSLEKFLSSKSNFFKRIAGMIVQLPKAVCYVLIVTFVFNIASMFGASSKLNEHLEGSKAYNEICKEIVIPITNSKIAKQLPGVINNSFKIVIKESDGKETAQGKNINKGRTIVYYNGVTLDQGIKSDTQIDRTAREITAKETTTKGKAKIIYNWIGNNVSYDHDKANKVLNNNFNVQSGAVPTFNTGKGICFDYSCLYVAMAKANNIKVRLITGEGFNGVSWVSHAWNQVYIPEEGKWINVDTTFYKGGNYFNSKRFEIDHRGAQIAGEW